MFPDKPPFYYKCKSCGNTFISEKKFNLISLIVQDYPKCPKCGSKDIESLDFMINK